MNEPPLTLTRDNSLIIGIESGVFLVSRITNTRIYTYNKCPPPRRAGASFSLPFNRLLRMDRILVRCLLAIIGYMVLGVVSFSRCSERWPVRPSYKLVIRLKEQ